MINMMHEMPGGYGTLRTTAVRLQHYVSHRAAQRSQAALEASAAPKFYFAISQIL